MTIAATTRTKTKKTKYTNTSCYITQHQYLALKTIHRKTRVPASELIRTGIDLVLKKYQSTLTA